MEKYEYLKDIGSGNFGVAKLMRDKKTKELVAVKFIERGDKVLLQSSRFHVVISKSFTAEPAWLWQIDENVQREIINHRSLRHPNIIRFKEVSKQMCQHSI